MNTDKNHTESFIDEVMGNGYSRRNPDVVDAVNVAIQDQNDQSEKSLEE